MQLDNLQSDNSSKTGNLLSVAKPRTVNVRLPNEIIQKLSALVQPCSFSCLTDVIRHILDHRKVVINQEPYNLDTFMWILSDIRQSLEMIFLNMGQANKLITQLKFMSFTNENKDTVRATEKGIPGNKEMNPGVILNELYQPIFEVITKLSYIWLSK